MKVSLNTVKQYIDFELPPVDELVERINMQLGGVEEVIDLGDKYKDAVIVRVIECDKHPNADKLSVCKVDAGENSPYSKFYIPNSDHLVEVVCGAPNVHADMWAVWLPPTSTVPASYGTDEPFVLDVREIRGVKSNGMLAALDELDLGSDHAGILEIDPDEWKPNDVEIKPGAIFAAAYGLDDTIIDIENKMFTHRPDLFGQLGVAREIAGILGHAFTSPEWYKHQPTFGEGSGLELIVTNEVPEKVPRLTAVAIKNVSVRPSPLWLQIELIRLGSKAINNIVDVTNYVMLLTAQPTHAYDYDKLRGHTLGARLAHRGESALLLNGKTYELSDEDIVIVDGDGVIGLGGIMGGGNSEVSAETKNVVLECATFDMYTVRKTSMRHGLFTDALTRFNKGQSALQQPYILHLLMMSLYDVAGGEQASKVFDDTQLEDGKWNMAVEIDEDFINARLGLKLRRQDIQNILENVEFGITDQPSSKDHLPSANIPFWRTDIEYPEDIVEEVGRLYGFEKLARELPRRSIIPAPRNARRQLKTRVRDKLSRAGANEVLTYSFVHENVMKKAGQNPEYAYKLSNALSPDLQYYRLSLMPSLLDKVHMNIKQGHDAFAIFELGKVHYKGEMDADEPTVPNEDTHIACVVAQIDKQKPSGAAYYQALRYLERVTDRTAYELTPLADFNLSTDEWGAQLTSAYEPTRAAAIVRDGQIWGVVGEFRADVTKAFKLPTYCAGFEVHIDTARINDAHYRPLSKYPAVTQDISLKVSSETPFDKVFHIAHETVAAHATNCDVMLTPLAIYQSTDDTSHKTISLRLKIASYDRTLTDADVVTVMDRVAAAATSQLRAERI